MAHGVDTDLAATDHGGHLAVRACDTLLEADVSGAARLLRISSQEAWILMERAVIPSLEGYYQSLSVK